MILGYISLEDMLAIYNVVVENNNSVILPSHYCSSTTTNQPSPIFFFFNPFPNLNIVGQIDFSQSMAVTD